MGDPVTTSLLVGTLLGAGAGVAASKMSQPKVPDAPKAPDVISNDTADAMASRRAERQRKQSAAAFGRSDTLLTGPSGLGGAGAEAGAGGKTLLGM